MATISGGDKLEAALLRIAAQLGDGATLRVGFLEGATYPDGTPVAAVAAFQDFGTRSIPPRPFFRNMVRRRSGGWPNGIATQLRQTGYNVTRTLELTGSVIQGQLKQSIIETNAPPLAPSTIRRKGFAKPLIETSHMINSVDYEVT